MHKVDRSCGLVQYLGVLPIDGVLLIPRVLSDGKLLSMSLAARVLVFLNPCFQPSLRLPYVNLTTLAGDLIECNLILFCNTINYSYLCLCCMMCVVGGLHY